MTRRSFGEDLAAEMSVKPPFGSLPAIVGTVLLRPVEILLGQVASAAILMSGGGSEQSQQRPPSNS
jgi:hypothetical protein